MSENRRKFLKDSAALVAFFSLPNITVFGANSEKNFGSAVVQLSVSKNFSLEKIMDKKPLLIAIGSLHEMESSMLNSGGQIATGLLDEHMDHRDMDSLVERVSKSTIPLVMSNLDSRYEELGSLVKPYRIVHSGKTIIGVMGISFAQPNQSLDQIITKLNEVSGYLKSQRSCDEVYCLIDNPESRFPYLTVMDFVSKTDRVNAFFSTTEKVPDTKLFSFPNRSGQAVLFQLQAKKSNRLGVLRKESTDRKEFYQLIN